MILMINCSYKGNNSNSRYFLGILEQELNAISKEPCRHLDIRSILTGKFEDFLHELNEADALVIGAPLYVDGLPAQAVRLLELLQEHAQGNYSHLPVYVVSNLGFYEPQQICNLFSIVENWCARMGMKYGGGIAIGAGPMIRILKDMPLKCGLNKKIGIGFENLAKAISAHASVGNLYCKTMIPRWVYKAAAHRNFRKELQN